MGRRLRILLRGISSLVALIVLVVGPPVGLVVFVGWPLPETLPTLEAITEGARSGVPDSVVINTLAVLGWLAWAQLALAVTIEAVALARRVTAPSLPMLPGMQLGAGRLLATAALLIGGLTSRTAPPEPTSLGRSDLPQQPIALIVNHDDPTPTDERPAFAPPSHVTATDTAEYVVQRNDSWWQIAETMLGDGLQWQTVRSANVGRTMADGTTIGSTTEIIGEGWSILVPTSGDSTSNNSPQGPAVPPADVVVERGDNLWEISEDHLETAIDRQATDAEIDPYWRDVIDENRDRLPDPANPSLIHPGQVLHLPASGPDQPAAPPTLPPHPDDPDPVPEPEQHVPATPAAPTTTAPTSTSTTPTTTAPSAADPPEADDRGELGAEDADHSDLPVAGSLGVAGTLLAAGISAAVLRRRRRREQHLPRGILPPNPPEELDDLRGEIVRRADTDQVDLLSSALAQIATAFRPRRTDTRVRIVQMAEGRLEALLSEPVLPAPDGWRPEASGTAWVIDDPETLGAVAAMAPSTPTHPLLVSIGSPDTNGQLYLDLEAEGLLNVTGSKDDIQGFVRSVTLELSTSSFAGDATVMIIGDAPSGDGLDRVHAVASWDEIADSAVSWAQQTRDLLAANRWTTPAAGRVVTERPDDLAPMVIVVSDVPDDERFAALCTTISEAIIPVVILGLGTSIEGATSIEIDAGRLRIPALGLECVAQTISTETSEQITELLEDAAALPEQLSLVPNSAENADAGTVPAKRGTYLDPPFDVLVRVLGEIEVIGGQQPLTPKPTAVVSFVALNSPVSADRVEDAIWSTPTENRRKRLANTVSETRTAIGAEHLPTAHDSKYRVGPKVKTDLELFDRRVEYARSQTPEEATETLRGALDFVDGPVFTYRNADRHAFCWVDTDNWISDAELKVTTTAEQLAERYVDSGDVAGAVWAARKGLTAVPTHSRLTAILMRAHADAGDREAAISVYESHVNALQHLDIDDVDADLVDLYDRLRRGERSA